MQRKTGRVENYTNTCLVLWGVNLLWILFLLWSVWGFLPVLLLTLGLNHLITRWQAHRSSA